MSLPIEREAARVRALMDRPEVLEAMAIRCEAQGHDWEPGISPRFKFVRVCRWCGEYV